MTTIPINKNTKKLSVEIAHVCYISFEDLNFRMQPPTHSLSPALSSPFFLLQACFSHWVWKNIVCRFEKLKTCHCNKFVLLKTQKCTWSQHCVETLSSNNWQTRGESEPPFRSTPPRWKSFDKTSGLVKHIEISYPNFERSSLVFKVVPKRVEAEVLANPLQRGLQDK